MKKIDLILICVITALLAAAFSPELVSPVQAAGVDQAALPGEVNAAQMDLPAETISPVAYLAVGLMALLFGSLTILPLLCAGNRKHTADR